MKPIIHIWYQNTTNRSIVLAELDMTIKRESTVDLLRHNPALTIDRIRKSEKNGILYQCVKSGKLIPVERPTIPEKNFTKFTESKEPIYSRSYSVIDIDPSEKDFIDQLEKEFIIDAPLNESEQIAINDKFLRKVDLEGFSDPLADSVEE